MENKGKKTALAIIKKKNIETARKNYTKKKNLENRLEVMKIKSTILLFSTHRKYASVIHTTPMM